MIEALVVDYIHEQSVNKETCNHLHGRAIYVPGRLILIEKWLPKYIGQSVPKQKFVAYIRQEAEQRYGFLRPSADSTLSQNPKKIVVPDSFPAWGYYLYFLQTGKHPEIADMVNDLLKPEHLSWPDDPFEKRQGRESDPNLEKYLLE